jgi:hypothetical protein
MMSHLQALLIYGYVSSWAITLMPRAITVVSCTGAPDEKTVDNPDWQTG